MTGTTRKPAEDGSNVEQFPVELCFDTIRENARFIPRNAFAVAGYVNGANTRFIWTPNEWRMFPSSGKLRINVTGSHLTGNVLDVEKGTRDQNTYPDGMTHGGKPEKLASSFTVTEAIWTQ